MKKTLALSAAALAALILPSAPLAAQAPQAPGDAASPSAAVPTPSLAASPAEAGKDPAAKVAQFFQTLMEGRVDTAYDDLLEGSKILEMPKDVTALKTKTKEAIHVFGIINGFEQVGKKDVGTRVTRLTCISQGANYPIRWRFYFYKPSDTWKLVDIRVDDHLTDLFDEPPRYVQTVPAQAPATTPAAPKTRSRSR